MTKLSQDQIETVVQILMQQEQMELCKIIDSPIYIEKGKLIKSDVLDYMKSNFPTESFADIYIKEAALIELGISAYITNVLHKIHDVMQTGIVPYDLNAAEYIVESLADARVKAYKERLLHFARGVLARIEREGGLGNEKH